MVSKTVYNSPSLQLVFNHREAESLLLALGAMSQDMVATLLSKSGDKRDNHPGCGDIYSVVCNLYNELRKFDQKARESR